MLSQRLAVATAAAASTAVISVTLVSVLPASGTPAVSGTKASAVSEALTSADVNTVNSVGTLLAAKSGSVVTVLRAPGRTIWDAVAAGDSTPETTPDVMAHDFLLVTSTENPSQHGYKALNHEAPPIGEVQVVLDEVTGRVLEVTRVLQGVTDPSAAAVANLGTPTSVTLSAASFR